MSVYEFLFLRFNGEAQRKGKTREERASDNKQNIIVEALSRT